MDNTDQARDTENILKGSEDELVITLKKPIHFEGESYESIDLTGLRDVRAADMVAVNRRLTRNGNAIFGQELSLEYALNLANIVTGLPLEFFDQLPPYAAMAVKNCVVIFLYGQD